MQVLLDGKMVVTPRASLAAALAAGGEAARRDGRIVVEVKADGRLVHGAALDHASDIEGEVSEVRLTSAEPRAVVRKTIAEAIEALEALRSEQGRAAGQLQTGETAEALQTLQGVFLTWQAVRDVVSRGAAVLKLDLDTWAAPDGETDFKTATTTLFAHLAQLREALTAQDWSAMSDTVEYDLDADATTWQGLLTALQASIGSNTTGAVP